MLCKVRAHAMHDVVCSSCALQSSMQCIETCGALGSPALWPRVRSERHFKGSSARGVSPLRMNYACIGSSSAGRYAHVGGHEVQRYACMRACPTYQRRQQQRQRPYCWKT